MRVSALEKGLLGEGVPSEDGTKIRYSPEPMNTLLRKHMAQKNSLFDGYIATVEELKLMITKYGETNNQKMAIVAAKCGAKTAIQKLQKLKAEEAYAGM